MSHIRRFIRDRGVDGAKSGNSVVEFDGDTGLSALEAAVRPAAHPGEV